MPVAAMLAALVAAVVVGFVAGLAVARRRAEGRKLDERIRSLKS